MQRILKYILCCFMTLTLFDEYGYVNAQQVLESNDKYVKETKVSKTIELSGALECVGEYGPTEILYGDTLYLDWKFLNVSEKIVPIDGVFGKHDLRMDIKITCPELSTLEYLYLPELNDTIEAPKDKITSAFVAQNKGKESKPMDLPSDFLKRPTWYLRPHSEIKPAPLALEFPPLEDWNQPFWKELREKMKPEGVICYLKVIFNNRFFNYQVLVKPRNASELKILEDWLGTTPDELYPKKSRWWQRKLTWETFLDDRSVELSPITIKNNKYPAYLFMRYGNRKPGVPNIPKSIDEWKLLEERLQPSTIRDEIVFTRMQIEYYDADSDDIKESKLNSLVAWIESLPGPQAAVYKQIFLERLKREFRVAKEIQHDLRELAVRLAPQEVEDIEDPERLRKKSNELLKEYNRQEASAANAKRVVALENAVSAITSSLNDNKWLTEQQKEALQETRKVLLREKDDIIKIDPTADTGDSGVRRNSWNENIPQMGVPQMGVPQMGVPQMDVPQMDVPQMDVLPMM